MSPDRHSHPEPAVNQDNVPGSQHGDTPHDQAEAARHEADSPEEYGGPGAEPELPESEQD